MTENNTPPPAFAGRTPAQALTYADIIAKATPAERTVYLYLNGRLLAVRDQLEAELDEHARLERARAREAPEDRSLVDVDPLETTREQLLAVLQELRASRVPFTFRALPMSRWDALRKKHEVEGGKLDLDAVAVPLVAAASCEPAMNEAEVAALFEQLNNSQRQALFECAWQVNTGAVDVPFSPASSAVQKARGSARN